MKTISKEKLDEILELNKAQPVGNGYIDIIVSRENYDHFIRDLIENGYSIESISWWEWCPNDKKNEYGLGGPRSKYYTGWFAELPIDLDDFNFSEEMENEEIIKEIIKRIEAKTISYLGEILTFNQNKWLTPALWLDVPQDWTNKYYD
jgi:hypothetical protein